MQRSVDGGDDYGAAVAQRRILVMQRSADGGCATLTKRYSLGNAAQHMQHMQQYVRPGPDPGTKQLYFLCISDISAVGFLPKTTLLLVPGTSFALVLHNV